MDITEELLSIESYVWNISWPDLNDREDAFVKTSNPDSCIYISWPMRPTSTLSTIKDNIEALRALEDAGISAGFQPISRKRQAALDVLTYFEDIGISFGGNLAPKSGTDQTATSFEDDSIDRPRAA